MGGSARVDDGGVATVDDVAAVFAALPSAYLVERERLAGCDGTLHVARVAVRQEGARG